MTREELARIALRYDTIIARAMLTALGVEVPSGRLVVSGVASRVDRFAGWEDAMRQTVGVRA